MNLGLALQSLAGLGEGRIQDAVAAYQRSLRVFNRVGHPQEFAILQNNLAAASLSIPFSDERSRLREALAVRAFEDGLAVVTLIERPREYASGPTRGARRDAGRAGGGIERSGGGGGGLVSSPGSGKTTLLERTIRDLGARCRADPGGGRAGGAEINTGAGCHLEADMIADAVKQLDPAAGDLLLIENARPRRW